MITITHSRLISIRNLDIKNLELITKEENMKRNTIHNLHPLIIENINLIKSINTRIKNKENTK